MLYSLITKPNDVIIVSQVTNTLPYDDSDHLDRSFRIEH